VARVGPVILAALAALLALTGASAAAPLSVSQSDVVRGVVEWELSKGVFTPVYRQLEITSEAAVSNPSTNQKTYDVVPVARSPSLTGFQMLQDPNAQVQVAQLSDKVVGETYVKLSPGSQAAVGYRLVCVSPTEGEWGRVAPVVKYDIMVNGAPWFQTQVSGADTIAEVIEIANHGVQVWVDDEQGGTQQAGSLYNLMVLVPVDQLYQLRQALGVDYEVTLSVAENPLNGTIPSNLQPTARVTVDANGNPTITFDLDGDGASDSCLMIYTLNGVQYLTIGVDTNGDGAVDEPAKYAVDPDSKLGVRVMYQLSSAPSQAATALLPDVYLEYEYAYKDSSGNYVTSGVTVTPPWYVAVRPDELIEVSWVGEPLQVPSNGDWGSVDWQVVPRVRNLAEFGVYLQQVNVYGLSSADLVNGWTLVQSFSFNPPSDGLIPAGGEWVGEAVTISPASSPIYGSAVYWKIEVQLGNPLLGQEVELDKTRAATGEVVVKGVALPVVPQGVPAVFGLSAYTEPTSVQPGTRTVTFHFKLGVDGSALTSDSVTVSISIPTQTALGGSASYVAGSVRVYVYKAVQHSNGTVSLVREDVTGQASITEPSSTSNTLTITLGPSQDLASVRYIEVVFQVNADFQSGDAYTISDATVQIGSVSYAFPEVRVTSTYVPDVPVISGEKTSSGFVVEANGFVSPKTGDFGMPMVVVDYVPMADVKDTDGDGQPDINAFLQNLSVTGRWGQTDIASAEYVGQASTGEYILALKDASGNVLAYLAVKVLGTVTIGNVDYYAILLYSVSYDPSSGTITGVRNMLPNTQIQVTYPSTYYDPNGVPVRYWDEIRLLIAVDPSSIPMTHSAGGPTLKVRLPTTEGAHQYSITKKGKRAVPVAIALLGALIPLIARRRF